MDLVKHLTPLRNQESKERQQCRDSVAESWSLALLTWLVPVQDLFYSVLQTLKTLISRGLVVFAGTHLVKVYENPKCSAIDLDT